jgi:hypothetical protein
MIKSTIKRLETLLKGSKDFSLTEKKAILKEVSKGVKKKPELLNKYKDSCTMEMKWFYLCPNCRRVQYQITEDYQYEYDLGIEKRCSYCGQRLDWRAAKREDKNVTIKGDVK